MGCRNTVEIDYPLTLLMSLEKGCQREEAERLLVNTSAHFPFGVVNQAAYRLEDQHRWMATFVGSNVYCNL